MAAVELGSKTHTCVVRGGCTYNPLSGQRSDSFTLQTLPLRPRKIDSQPHALPALPCTDAQWERGMDQTFRLLPGYTS